MGHVHTFTDAAGVQRLAGGWPQDCDTRHPTTPLPTPPRNRLPVWKIVTRDAADARHDILVPGTSLPAAVAAAEKTLGGGERITAAFLSAAPEHPCDG